MFSPNSRSLLIGIVTENMFDYCQLMKIVKLFTIKSEREL